MTAADGQNRTTAWLLASSLLLFGANTASAAGEPRAGNPTGPVWDGPAPSPKLDLPESASDPAEVPKLQPQTPSAQQSARVRSQLQRFAQGVSELLADGAARAALNTLIERADGPDKAIHVRDWLERVSERVPVSDGLKAQARQITDLQAETGVGARPRIDLLIPTVRERTDWHEAPLLVAADPLRPDGTVDSLRAYEIGGRETRVSVAEPPARPLLMVAPDEHTTHDFPAPRPADDVPMQEREVPGERRRDRSALPGGGRVMARTAWGGTRSALKALPASTAGNLLANHPFDRGSIGVPKLEIKNDQESKFWRATPEIEVWLHGPHFTHKLDTISGSFATHLFNEDGNLSSGEIINLGDRDVSDYDNRVAGCAGFLLNPYGRTRVCLYVTAPSYRLRDVLKQRTKIEIKERDPGRVQHLYSTTVDSNHHPFLGYNRRGNGKAQVWSDLDRRRP